MKGWKNVEPIELQTPTRKVQWTFVVVAMLILASLVFMTFWVSFSPEEQESFRRWVIVILVLVIALLILSLHLRRQSKKKAE